MDRRGCSLQVLEGPGSRRNPFGDLKILASVLAEGLGRQRGGEVVATKKDHGNGDNRIKQAHVSFFAKSGTEWLESGGNRLLPYICCDPAVARWFEVESVQRAKESCSERNSRSWVRLSKARCPQPALASSGNPILLLQALNNLIHSGPPDPAVEISLGIP